ncbi:MAG: AsmA family protein [Methylotenera sp.]|nr:AsmA family protein [Methylotenera sp.]
MLIILPFLIPVHTYLQQAEKIGSEKLGVPVIIGSGHLTFLPSPRIVLNDISVGEHQEARFGRVVAIPTLSSLFSDTKIIDINISKPVIKQAVLDIVAALSAKKPESDAASSVHIHHININDLELVWPNSKYPLLNVEATLKDGSQLESAIVDTQDGKVKVNITPQDDEQLVVIDIDHWTSPIGLPMLIDTAKIEGHLKNSRLDIPKIDVALYNGKLTGNAVLNWQKGWKLNGKVKVEQLAVKGPSSLVSKSVYLSGNLFGNGDFSSSAKEAGGIADNFQANFKFKVNDGVLHGVDLVKMASLLVKQREKGGETQFEEFAGLLNIDGKQYHLKDIKISSGMLAASGQVKVMPNKELDGTVEVDLKSGMGLAAIPLDVSGTINEPTILPSKAAIAGAVAGTAILGPGIGTSLGVKAGSAVSKIIDFFGNKK